MDTLGKNVQQLCAFAGSYINPNLPSKVNDVTFYEDYGIWARNKAESKFRKIINNSSVGYSVSKTGVIAFVNFNLSALATVDKFHACIWLADIDGSNQRPLVTN